MRKFFARHFYENSSTICESEVSQAVADLCDPPPGTNPPTLIVYTSTRQTCVLTCSDGTVQTYSVAPGGFLDFTQALADRKANAFACRQAAILCNHGTTQEVYNQPQTCTLECPGSSHITTPAGVIIGGVFKTYTTPAGFFLGSSQAEANTLAYEFACLIASLMCAQPPGGGGTDGGTTGGTGGGDVTGGGQGIPVTGGGSGTDSPTSPVWFANSAQSATVNCPLGGTFTLLVASGQFFKPTRAQADAVALSYARSQVDSEPYCLSSITNHACAGEVLAATISVSPSVDVTWTLQSGTVPVGMTFSGGVLSGTPLVAGSYSFLIRATQSNGSYSQRSYSIQVISLMVNLPIGQEDTAYSAFPSQSGGTLPVNWSISDGALPTGLSINPSTGEVSGTPTDADTFVFTVEVEDANGFRCDAVDSIEITPVSGFSWNNLIWDAPFIQVENGGSSSASALGPDMASVTSVPTLGFASGDTTAVGSITGNIIGYNGPAVNCNLHVVQTNTGYIDPSNAAVCGVGLFWSDPGLTILVNFAIYVTGVYDYPFVIPASTNADIQISFYGASFAQFPNPGQACTCTGVLTVLP